MENVDVSAVMDCVMDGVIVLRAVRAPDGTVTEFDCARVNDSAAKAVGLTVDEMTGEHFSTIWPASKEVGMFDTYVRLIGTTERFTHELRSGVGAHHGDDDRWFEFTVDGLSQPADRLVVAFRESTDNRHLTGILSEMRERHRVLERQALHDPLTGLANRLLLDTRLGHAIRRLDRYDVCVAVLFVDLDGLKAVNDTYGHQAGDIALTKVSRRLKQIARSYDTVSRVGGDEFVVVCEDPISEDDVLGIAHRYLDACTGEIDVGPGRVDIAASIGIAIADSCTIDPNDLIADADRAMYRAKVSGGGRIEFADAAVGQRTQSRVAAHHMIGEALLDGDLDLRFEPIIRAHDQTVAATVVRLNWGGPWPGAVPDRQTSANALNELLADPSTPLSLVVDAGYHVIRRAVEQAARWTDRFEDPPEVIAHTPAALLLDHGFVDGVIATLYEFGVGSGRLCLSVGDDFSTADSPRTVVDTIERLDAAGVYLQRRGVGVTSTPMQYTRRFPIPLIELDPKLVATVNSGGMDIVAAVHEVAKSRGARVTSPGVRSQSHANALIEVGSDFLRGPFVSPPLSVDDFEAFVDAAAATLVASNPQKS